MTAQPGVEVVSMTDAALHLRLEGLPVDVVRYSSSRELSGSATAAWALGGVGDRRAIPALIESLDDTDALMRTSAIGALARLEAAEALPRLRTLVNDPALPRAGDQISVGERAKAAIAAIERAAHHTR
jgi:HEAT repeat protein